MIFLIYISWNHYLLPWGRVCSSGYIWKKLGGILRLSSIFLTSLFKFSYVQICRICRYSRLRVLWRRLEPCPDARSAPEDMCNIRTKKRLPWKVFKTHSQSWFFCKIEKTALQRLLSQLLIFVHWKNGPKHTKIYMCLSEEDMSKN